MAVRRGIDKPKIRPCLLIIEGVVATCLLKRQGFCGDFNQQAICARTRQEEQQAFALSGYSKRGQASVLIDGVRGSGSQSKK